MAQLNDLLLAGPEPRPGDLPLGVAGDTTHRAAEATGGGTL
jgi:hypothetical protein